MLEYEYEEYHNEDDNNHDKDSQVHVQKQGKEEKAISKREFDITNIICYNCGLTGHFNSVFTNAANPEQLKRATAARDKGK